MSRKFAIAAALAFASVALAEDPFSNKESSETNVGPLGFGAEATDKSLTVRSLVSGGPAEKAGLKSGDQVTGVDGRAFDGKPEPAIAIVLACEAAEATAKRDATVTLTVNGKELKVSFPSQGKHSATCPKKCKKCEKVVQEGVAYLVAQQKSDGSFPTELGGKTGTVVVTSLSGLALMAAGGADDAVAKAAGYVLAKCGAADESGLKLGGGNWNQENWELGYGALFLGELAKKTKRSDVKAKLFEIAKRIEANQETSGGWAHGPGGPNALGYLELEIVGNWSLMGLGAARKNGYTLDKKRLEKSVEWIQETTRGDGGVGYSPRDGQKGFGEAGRTSGAIAAFAGLGLKQHPFFQRMANFYRGRMTTLASGHVSPWMHMTSGAIAAHILGPKDWSSFIEAYRPQIYAARKSDGSFAAIPTRESDLLHSNTDLTVGSSWTTASAVLILALPNERVPVLVDKAATEKPEKAAKQATGSNAPKEDDPRVK
jgi:hypothetical protein